MPAAPAPPQRRVSEMHTNQPRLTLTLSKVCLGLLCPMHLSRCLPNCISFLSPNPPVSEGRVPEPGSRCTHCRPQPVSPQGLVPAAQALSGRSSRHLSPGLVGTGLRSQPAQLGKNESAVSCPWPYAELDPEAVRGKSVESSPSRELPKTSASRRREKS